MLNIYQRIADASRRIIEAGQRAIARQVAREPFVGSVVEQDEHGFVRIRPVRASEAHQHIEAGRARFDEAMARLRGDDKPTIPFVDWPASRLEIAGDVFQCTVYDGGLLPPDLVGISLPWVVDLSAVKISTRRTKLFLDGVSNQRLGHSTAVRNNGRTIEAEGKLSAKSESRTTLLESAANGYPWATAPIWTMPKGKAELLTHDKTAKLNGRTVTGPAIVFSNAELLGVHVF